MYTGLLLKFIYFFKLTLNVFLKHILIFTITQIITQLKISGFGKYDSSKYQCRYMPTLLPVVVIPPEV